MKRMHEWRLHCLRHASNGWTGSIHMAMDQDELGIRRALSGVDRPGTRITSGFIFKRLSESYADVESEYRLCRSEL